MPITQNRQYRTAGLLEAQEGAPSFMAEGYAVVFDKPYVLYDIDGVEIKEVIRKSAFDDVDLSDVIMQYDHMGKVLARTSNGTLQLSVDDYGLKVTADLSKTSKAKELYEEIKEGMIKEMSWGFTIRSSEYDEDAHTIYINEVKKVYDVSAVSIPANPDTEISARSFVDGVIAKVQELQERKRKLALAKAKYNYRRIKWN